MVSPLVIAQMAKLLDFPSGILSKGQLIQAF
jgi:hypothetical protein